MCVCVYTHAHATVPRIYAICMCPKKILYRISTISKIDCLLVM